MNEVVWDDHLSITFDGADIATILDIFLTELGYKGRSVCLCFCSDATITDYNDHYRKKKLRQIFWHGPIGRTILRLIC